MASGARVAQVGALADEPAAWLEYGPEHARPARAVVDARLRLGDEGRHLL
jgi:riboflavin biosynthesis pyrimidine reductase